MVLTNAALVDCLQADEGLVRDLICDTGLDPSDDVFDLLLDGIEDALEQVFNEPGGSLSRFDGCGNGGGGQ